MMKEIELHYDESIEIILHRKWVLENKSVRQIMSELHIGYETVYDWLKRAGIYSRRLGIYKKQDQIFY